jgi:AcrR family transcriptional regulator
MEKSKQHNTSGRTYGGESAAERLSRQRQQFMDAGLELFGTVGYRATTVRILCKQAGLTDRYFYKTFSDTEDLLAAVYTESLDQIQAEVIEAISDSSDHEPVSSQIDAGLEAFFSAFENARVARVCWLEVLGVSPRIALIGAISQSALHWLLEDYHSPRATLVRANGRLIRGLINTLPAS